MHQDPFPVEKVVSHIEEASRDKKCWSCGCFHDALRSLVSAHPESEWPSPLADAIQHGMARLTGRRYDCLGCEVCPPALTLNVLEEGGIGTFSGGCPTVPPEILDGWPPLPGRYQALRYQAPVAVCLLSDRPPMEVFCAGDQSFLSIVGILFTENLGIERVITNVLSNPHIRFLIVAGEDSRRSVGHLPGQSLLALGENGIDGKGRIIGAQGKRPVIHNISREAVDHFRKFVQLVDLRDVEEPARILAIAEQCASQSPGMAPLFPKVPMIEPLKGTLPSRVILDPAGYFVIFPDPLRKKLVAEHFQNNGRLDRVVEGTTPPEITSMVIEQGLISRMDHAAYLGQELARAEYSLLSRIPYVQDKAPEAPSDTSPKRDPSCGLGGCP